MEILQLDKIIDKIRKCMDGSSQARERIHWEEFKSMRDRYDGSPEARHELCQLADRAEEQLKELSSQLDKQYEEKLEQKKQYELQYQKLIKLAVENKKFQASLTRRLQWIHSESEQVSIQPPFIPLIDVELDAHSEYIYKSEEEAKEQGLQRLKTRFNEELESLILKTRSHYQRQLDYIQTHDNFFHSIHLFLNEQLKHLNDAMAPCLLEIPDIQFPSLHEMQIMPEKLAEKAARAGLLEDLQADSIGTEWQIKVKTEKFLILLNRQVKERYYAYHLTEAIGLAREEIAKVLTDISQELQRDLIDKKYKRCIKRIEETVFPFLVEVEKISYPYLHRIEVETKSIEQQCSILYDEILVIKDALEAVFPRVDILTERKMRKIPASSSPSLDEVLNQLENGSVLYLEQGQYPIKNWNTLEKSFSIRGAGKECTTILVETEAGISWKGKHTLSIHNVEFKGSGASGPILTADGLDIIIESARFEGEFTNHAILIEGETEAVILDSDFERFHYAMQLETSGSIQIKGCRLAENREYAIVAKNGNFNIHSNQFSSNKTGLALFEKARGKAEGNQFHSNTNGIIAAEDSSFLLIGNSLKENSGYGIHITDKANCTVERNECTQNGTGILCSQFAKAFIKENHCFKNEENGIGLMSHASAQLTNNRCTENRIGIEVADQGKLEAKNNICSKNHIHGVFIRDSARVDFAYGQCRGNKETGLCSEGESHLNLQENQFLSNPIGLRLTGKTSFRIGKNVCEGNTHAGITLEDEANGEGKENQCTENQNGVIMSGKCSVLWDGNDCSGNLQNGLAFFGQVTGRVTHNLCSGNGVHGIFLEHAMPLDLSGNRGKGKADHPWKLPFWKNQSRKLSSRLRSKGDHADNLQGSTNKDITS